MMTYSLFGLWIAWFTAHLLGDFVLQTSRVATGKADPALLGRHAGFHALLALAVSGRWDRWAVLAAASIGTVHGAIDRVKAQVDNRDGSTKGFLVDQLAHLIWLSTLAVWLGPKMTASRWTEAFGPDWVRALILTAGAIICVRATGFMIGFAVRPYLEEIKQAKVKSAPDFQSRGLTNGGRTIGQWERALIFLLVIVGQPGGIGFLIAAKSIFRFGELKDPDNRREAEYITIGTLMSFGSAIGIAYATLWVANHLVR